MLMDVFMDAVLDCLKELPFLFAAFLLLEALEHRFSERMNRALLRAGHAGPLIGALVGCIPQCGFSIMASNFFAGGVISLGTLLAVFLSTSDEAVILLLSNPGHMADIGRLIASKIVIALIAGYAVHGAEILFRRKHPGRRKRIRDLCEECGCHDGEAPPLRVKVGDRASKGNSRRNLRHILKPALRHTAEVFFFLFVVSLLLGFLLEAVGMENVSRLFMADTIFQPVIAGLIGLIPNCAASVILTELYLEGVISFGSAIAGLCSAAGLGLLVLFRINRDKKEALFVTGCLFGIASLAGMVVEIFF